MRAVPAGVRILAAVIMLGAVVLPASCRVIRDPGPTSEMVGPLSFRIENATASTADVTITIGEPAATAGRETPTDGAEDRELAGRFIAEEDLAAEATVRVGASTYSEGELLCGQQILISATVGDEGETLVLLEGSGTGTPGFDEGSVGLSGERTLLFDVHYACGDTVVIRIEDDGTGVGGSTSSVGLGEVAVYVEGQVPPVGDLPVIDSDSPTEEDEATADGSDGQTPAGTDTVSVTIDNQTGSGIALELRVGTGDTEADELIEVTVIGFGIANGVLACAQQVTLRALIIDSETGEDGAEPTLYQIMLTGEGTGTAGFDEATIGPGNSRILQQDQHFQCGDTILITILDDASDVDEEEDETARIGLGWVEVVAASS